MAETAGFGRIVKDSKIHYLDVGIAEHTGFTIAAAATKSFDLTFIHIYSTFYNVPQMHFYMILVLINLQ